MSRLSLYLLGPPRIERDGEPIKVDTRKAIALLAYIAITGESHRRDALVNLLWPEYDQTRGRAALRRTLSALYEEGGHVEKAVEYLLKAGEKTKRNSANEAAIAHLTRGLALLETSPKMPGHVERELDLQIALGVPLVLARGHGAPEVERTYWFTEGLDTADLQEAGAFEKMILKTTGVYGIVRNPIYLADLLFSLGLAIMFRSIIGVALVPLWWAGFFLLVLIEEGSLERTLGQPYLDYKQRVKGRIVPGLPI